jgi:hypothetical protein
MKDLMVTKEFPSNDVYSKLDYSCMNLLLFEGLGLQCERADTALLKETSVDGHRSVV